MRVVSKRFKREVVSVATTIAVLVLYIPFMDSRWSIYAAMCAGYTVAVFGLAWSDGKMRVFLGEHARSFGQVLQVHAVFLLLLIGWIWLAQATRPFLPSWVIAEGDHRESWLLVFALFGIVGLLLFEHWWLSKAPKKDALTT